MAMKDGIKTTLRTLFLQRAIRPLTVTTLACLPLSALAQAIPATLYAPGTTDLSSTIQQAIVTNP